MTQQITTTCDRCKAIFGGEPAMSISIWTDRKNEKFDLCGLCVVALVAWIKKGTFSVEFHTSDPGGGGK